MAIEGRRLPRVRRAAVLGLIIVAALIVIVPWQGALDRLGDAAALPPVPAAGPTLDSALALLSRGLSWRVEPDFSFFLVRNVEFATRPHWRLVAAYGPWSFLYRGYHPRNYVPLVLAWSAFAILAVLLLRDDLVAAAALVIVLAADPRPGLLLVFPLLVFVKRKQPALAIAGVVAMALMGLVKSSALTLGVIVAGAMTIEDLRKRRAPLALIVYAASFAGFWLLAGQDAAWLWPFLRGTWHVASAYGEALVGGAMAWRAVLLLALGAAIVGWRAWRQRDVVETMALAAILFAFAKASLVRNDLFHETLLPMAITTLLLVYAPRYAAIAAVAIIVPFLPAPGEIGRQAVALANPVAAKRKSDALYARDLASIRARVPKPPIAGSVDVYGNWQSVAIAHGLDYRPRPVFQSYIAYDAALAKMNADVLRGDDAPQTILFAINFTDRRYPALDDALSWPELLARYEPVAASRDFLALRRAARPATLRPLRLRTLDGRLGEPIAIPPDAGPLVWAHVYVEPTMSGKLLAFAYKLPELTIAVDGIEGRFIRRTASAGFLLSPIVTQPVELYGQRPAHVVTIRGGGLYEPRVTLILQELRLERGR